MTFFNSYRELILNLLAILVFYAIMYLEIYDSVAVLLMAFIFIFIVGIAIVKIFFRKKDKEFENNIF